MIEFSYLAILFSQSFIVSFFSSLLSSFLKNISLYDISSQVLSLFPRAFQMEYQSHRECNYRSAFHSFPHRIPYFQCPTSTSFLICAPPLFLVPVFNQRQKLVNNIKIYTFYIYPLLMHAFCTYSFPVCSFPFNFVYDVLDIYLLGYVTISTGFCLYIL